eukprot:1884252-Pleurochrysis_carterae.AAC.1
MFTPSRDRQQKQQGRVQPSAWQCTCCFLPHHPKRNQLSVLCEVILIAVKCATPSVCTDSSMENKPAEQSMLKTRLKASCNCELNNQLPLATRATRLTVCTDRSYFGYYDT